MNDKELEQLYIKKYGKKTTHVLNFLMKEKKFIEAISTEVGQEIMDMLIRKADEKMGKFISLIPTNESLDKLNIQSITTLAEYNVCLSLIRDVQTRINKYNTIKIGP